MTQVVIVGAGGFGREVLQWARHSLGPEHQIKGFLSNNSGDLDAFPGLPPILGHPEHYPVPEQERFLLAIGDVSIRKRVAEAMVARGARFLTLVHHTAVIADSARLGEGVIVCPFALVSDSVVLEDSVMMNIYACCGHDARVGRYSVLSGYAAVAGRAVLEEEVFLATHATVIPRKRVGARSMVSANSAVMRNVPPRSLVSVVPGKITRNFVP